MDSFLTMRAMVEEMYREFKKGRDEDSSNSKQDKGAEESLLHDHSKGKGKEEKLPTASTKISQQIRNLNQIQWKWVIQNEPIHAERTTLLFVQL